MPTEIHQESDRAGAASDARRDDFDAWSAVATVELDRFCKHCGYNLRTQVVRRQPVTDILMARCPECAAFHAASESATASRPWLHRLTVLAAIVWMVFLVGVPVALTGLTIALNGVILDEFTTYRQVTTAGANPNTRVTRYVTVVRTDVQHHDAFIALLATCAAALACFGVMLAVVALPHWPRVAYIAAAVGMPILAASAFLIDVSFNQPQHFAWVSRYTLLLAAAQIVAATPFTLVGRPLARGMVCILLPTRLRNCLAYLWLVDGRTPPAAGGRLHN